MKSTGSPQRGFSLIELFVALAIGLLLIGAVISVSMAQSQVYRSANAQASIQTAENAIAALVVPTVRGAGFTGCSTLGTSVSNLTNGGPSPLGTLGTSQAMVAGYDYMNTAGAGSTLTLATDNPANDATAAHWSPSLDSTLVGSVMQGSDVLVVLGAVPGSTPVGSTAATAGNTISVSATSGFSVGVAAISDCLKSSIFKVTAVNATSLSHDLGAGVMANATAALSVNYPPGAQVVPMQQVAFFVAHDAGSTAAGATGQSVLTRATYVPASASWNLDPLVPGVEAMQVLYGIGAAGTGLTTQYVAAGAVTDWSAVYSVRLAFLIEGQAGSAQGALASAPVLLGTTVTPPADTLLRHVYETTINLRNATP